MAKIYISGPITGYLNLNKGSFDMAEALLKERGDDPVNPHKILAGDLAFKWDDYLRADLKVLCDCDGIYLLPRWQMSRGAKLEYTVAQELGLTIEYAPAEIAVE